MKKVRDENSAFTAQKGRGRPKGVPNRATTEFRDTIRALLENNATNVEKWLKEVAEGDVTSDRKPDPYKALDLMAKLAEYAAPKLARTELIGDSDAPVVTKMVFEWQEPK
jgi:hypothetical protein